MSFSRGIYHLLTNPLYVGQISCKGICHKGQHEGIIDLPLWEQVQQRLANNRAGVIEKSRKTESGSLHGKLFDAETGETLVVVHANKKGRRYRYYVSQALKTDTKADAPDGWRVPRSGIEASIGAIVKTILNDRDTLMDACAAAHISSHQIPALLTRVCEVAQFQAHVFNTFLRRAELRPDAIRVTLSLSALVSPNAVAVISLSPAVPRCRSNGAGLKCALSSQAAWHPTQPWIPPSSRPSRALIYGPTHCSQVAVHIHG